MATSAASPVEAASASAAAEASATTAAEAAASGITMEAATITAKAASSVAATIACAVAVSAIAVSAAEPGACADEEAAIKPCGTVISVRRTSVGRITVVAPLANRSSIVATVPVPGVDANPNRNLGVRVGRWNQQNTKQREIP